VHERHDEIASAVPADLDAFRNVPAFIASIAGLGIILALTLPAGQIARSGWAYFSMALLVPLHARYRR